jgi:murein DD-endopeptidase MepM/ murein hydrolase activator NlpD
MTMTRAVLRTLILGTTAAALAACTTDPSQLDWDLRPQGLSTSEAARSATAERPMPDNRGVISYPGYQVAVARRGDTVGSVAARVGVPVAELASYNAVQPDTVLNQGEVLALPRRVTEPSPATGALTTGPITPSTIEVTAIATTALDRAAGSGTPPAAAATPQGQVRPDGGVEPIRHQVRRGETAYSIARSYNVTAKSLAEWNGLSPDLAVREGQYLLIPVTLQDRAAVAETVTVPGQGSPTPQPPSAAKPLPAEKPLTPAETRAAQPASPDLGQQRTTEARLAMPLTGSIIRGYTPKRNEGIDIAAAPGTAVKAAADGTVAAITQDTDQVPILVIRHPDNLLTVYANIDAIAVQKGDNVKRGQSIAKVRGGDPSFLHFEVRQGFEAVDPMPYLQ